jgi:hypothetical protein
LKPSKRTAKVVNGVELRTSTINNCEPYSLSKYKQNISRVKQTPSPRIPVKLHVDIIGPIVIKRIDVERHWMLRTDGKSHRNWLSTSNSRAALDNQLVTWCRELKTQTGLTIFVIHCDNAHEFLNARNQQYFDSEGITV